MKGANVKVFDQVTAVPSPARPAAACTSKTNGEYIGMLTQGVMQLQGFNFIVPVRRIHAWAKAAKIEWAIDPDVPMPSLKEIEAIPVEDAGQSPGGYPQRNPAGGPDEGGARLQAALQLRRRHQLGRASSFASRGLVGPLESAPCPASCDRQHLSRVAMGSATRPLLHHQPARAIRRDHAD